MVIVTTRKRDNIGRSAWPLTGPRDRACLFSFVRVRGLSADSEKVAQQFAGAPFLDASVNFRPVMRRRLVEQAGPMLDRTALWIIGPEVEPAQARPRDRRGAHRAGFEGDVEIALGQARGP